MFLNLLNAGKIENVSVDCSKTNELIKLLDTVVIKLEGGTDEDLALLEQEYSGNLNIILFATNFYDIILFVEMEKKSEQKLPEEEEKKSNAKIEETTSKDDEVIEVKVEKSDEVNDASKVNGQTEELENKKEEETNEDKENKENKIEEKSNGPKDNLDGSTEDKLVNVEEKEDKKSEVNSEEKTEKEEKFEKDKKEKKRKRSYSGSSNSSSSSNSDSEEEKDQEEKEDKKDEKEQEKDDVQVHIEMIEDDPKPEKPKSLHKTTSIFLRNLAPTITKQEVEAMCSRYDGFLRVALADPQPERRWLRRGWVTFKRDANIKEICWNLNNIRLRDCELGAIVNRDLSRRIRPVNGITAHKQVVRSDIRISAKVVLHLDTKAGLWIDKEKKDKPQQSFGLVSNNPILHNITDYLIEEASAEEEELLGLEPASDPQDSTATVERDDALISVLDKIILYLRIVHSVDYYNHCEYPNEDEMPNRCGILHARGPPPTAKTDITQFIGAAIETKMANFLPEKQGQEENKNEVKLVNLSLKDVDTEIDKFVQANTRELSKDKWLCPLSGKKFKGPDFVRKHIFNKHAEKIEEVKKEVEFFNNYLKDPKRPMLAETPQPKREEQSSFSHPT